MKPYNMLNEDDKEKIVEKYYSDYEFGITTFKELAFSIEVSERAFSRVLREKGINTKRRNKYTLNEKYFNVIDTQEKAYLLGVLFSDGCVTDYNYIVLQQSDYESINLFKKEIEFTGEIKEITGKQAGGFSSPSTLMYRMHFSSEEMSKDLINLGKHHHMKTHVLPDIHEYLLPHFIRGYFDGDGGFYLATKTSYFKGKKYVYPNPIFSIICTTDFANNLNDYFKKNLKINNMKIVKSRTDGMVYFESRSKKNCITIYNHLYKDSTCHFERKYAKFTEFMATCTSDSA